MRCCWHFRPIQGRSIAVYYIVLYSGVRGEWSSVRVISNHPHFIYEIGDLRRSVIYDPLFILSIRPCKARPPWVDPRIVSNDRIQEQIRPPTRPVVALTRTRPMEIG